MVQLKEKFLVINLKRFEELNKAKSLLNCGCKEAICPHLPLLTLTCEEVEDVYVALRKFWDIYEKVVGNNPRNKYYVCNQDELYAQKVIDIILAGESAKEHETTF